MMSAVLIAAGLASALVGGVFLRVAWALLKRGPSVGGQLYEHDFQKATPND